MDVTNRLMICLLLCVSVIGLATGCVRKDNDQNRISKVETSNTTKIKIVSVLESWVGKYTFSEYAPPDQNMFYRIQIFKDKDGYYAEIYIDGFQTLERLRAKVSGDRNSIKLLFDKYLPGSNHDFYNKGDILLHFKRENSRIYTYWGEITPMLANTESGRECFVREK